MAVKAVIHPWRKKPLFAENNGQCRDTWLKVLKTSDCWLTSKCRLNCGLLSTKQNTWQTLSWAQGTRRKSGQKESKGRGPWNAVYGQAVAEMLRHSQTLKKLQWPAQGQAYKNSVKYAGGPREESSNLMAVEGLKVFSVVATSDLQFHPHAHSSDPG